MLILVFHEHVGFFSYAPVKTEELIMSLWFYPAEEEVFSQNYVLSLQDIRNYKQLGFSSLQEMLFFYIKELLFSMFPSMEEQPYE
jgi:hypothetical protein